MFKQDLYVPYHAHNDECMYKVSDGNDFMESMSEYTEYGREMKWCLTIFRYGVKRGCLRLF